jgi:hypothetical protein
MLYKEILAYCSNKNNDGRDTALKIYEFIQSGAFQDTFEYLKLKDALNFSYHTNGELTLKSVMQVFKATGNTDFFKDFLRDSTGTFDIDKQIERQRKLAHHNEKFNTIDEAMQYVISYNSAYSFPVTSTEYMSFIAVAEYDGQGRYVV